MSKQENEKNPKLGNYVTYGMTFGLLAGVLLSIVGTKIENLFIQIAGPAIGLSFGTVIGALVYSFGSRNR